MGSRRRPSGRAGALALLLAVAACGGDDDGGRDSSPFVDASDLDAPPPPDALTADCACGDTQGCLTLIVGRTADDSMMPWVLFPSEADGTGTLIASAAHDPTTLARRLIEDVDLVSVPARTTTVALGCVPAGDVTVRVFLDDQPNAEPADITSADYRDTCLLDRAPTATVAGGARTTFVSLSLARTCD